LIKRGNFIDVFLALPSLKYLHLDEGIFCRVRRLAWCNDPESYAGGSIATGRATLAGQVKGEHPDKERYTGPPGWGLGRWASTPSPGKKTYMLKNLGQRNLNEGQWEDRKQWSLGVGQRRTTYILSSTCFGLIHPKHVELRIHQ